MIVGTGVDLAEGGPHSGRAGRPRIGGVSADRVFSRERNCLLRRKQRGKYESYAGGSQRSGDESTRRGWGAKKVVGLDTDMCVRAR